VVVAVAGGTERLSPVPGTRARVAPASLWEFVRASGLAPLVICDSKNPNAKFTVVLVSRASGRAVLAIKAPTTDAAARAVEAESRMLLQLRDLDLTMGSTIPRFQETVELDGRPALVMTAVDGASMRTSYLRWRHTARRSSVEADFAAVETWLADFQGATATGIAPLEPDGALQSRIAERFAGHTGLDQDLEQYVELCGRLRPYTTPRTAVHGDLWTNNLLLREGRVSGVVDWEGGEREGGPARDVARFALMYALFLDRRTRAGRRVAGHRAVRAGAWGATVEYAIGGCGWFPDLFRDFLQRNLVRLGAPASAWRDAALAGVAEVAALADDDEFARLHLELFRRLASPMSQGRPRLT
jgi:aminoglycoside phosphotransferase (APT) family kinase protein